MTSLADRPLVLLADDYDDARDLYRAYLEMHGFRVVTAADGPAALERAREATPAAIFLDIGMPRMSGLEVARAIKADPRLAGVPVVALSAHPWAPSAICSWPAGSMPCCRSRVCPTHCSGPRSAS